MKTLPRLCFLSIFGALSFSYTVAQNALITPETPSSTTTEQQFSHKINDNTYIYYYGQTCGHCKKVEDYLKKS
ncbi:MAG: hypothetical protein LBP53_01565 [Candidatus Peribacteria bacterium]|jgi:hypothetical protein|nr:hypothetical protein [Candidatus Peribacteria bacterium]